MIEEIKKVLVEPLEERRKMIMLREHYENNINPYLPTNYDPNKKFNLIERFFTKRGEYKEYKAQEKSYNEIQEKLAPIIAKKAELDQQLGEVSEGENQKLLNEIARIKTTQSLEELGYNFNSAREMLSQKRYSYCFDRRR